MVLSKFVRINRRIPRRFLPILFYDPVGDIHKLSVGKAMLLHMAFRARQQGHHIVAMFIAVILRHLHQDNIGMVRAHPAELDGAERPKVVHLVDQQGAGLLRDLAGGINIQRICRGGDHRIGLALRRDLFAVLFQPVEEGEHIFYAPQSVSLVGRPRNPKIPDAAVHLLHGRLPAHIGILRAQMGIGARHNGDIVPGLHPALRHKIRPVFHAVFIGTGIMVDIDDIQMKLTPSLFSMPLRFSGWPSHRQTAASRAPLGRAPCAAPFAKYPPWSDLRAHSSFRPASPPIPSPCAG